MPTISLYDPTAADDAWHRVHAPGGYEWWYFDAEDTKNNRQIVAIFLEGFIFHPGYLRAYHRYRRRPTSAIPPLPRDFACVYFVVYEAGKVAHQFMTQYPARSFTAKPNEPWVAIGPNRFNVEESILKLQLQGTDWKLTALGPKLLENQILTASLSFDSAMQMSSHRREFVSKDISGGDHHWIVTNPLCSVRGRIDCAGRSIEFNGKGYHDHNYGTAPLGPGIKRWFWGRVLFDDSVVMFHIAQPVAHQLKDEIHLLLADSGGITDLPVSQVHADWSARSSWMLPYPNSVDFPGKLQLWNAALIDSSPFYLRLAYDVRFGDKTGKAFCEVAYPHRLRWPILGRMIETSIDKRPLKGD
ncbi:MAG TPA: hypothetical protein VHD56_03155 [Tepidisphaeraceae bacterium]|nr:hypothetical protein [Tepidisphaeraceae bacterium]